MKTLKACKFISSDAITPFLEWVKEMAPLYPEIHCIKLFGSFAREEATDISDIDLAVSVSNTTSWGSIAEKIKSNKITLKKIDVVCFEKASEKLKKKIDKEGIPIYENKDNSAKS
ncbi:MAG: nucleotidyltransferase domain-containing protein [Deltaproteobacteria bacterium]|nr:nucleotidyltransferase domain-containing protein [Deltaproteobacteria bacterium]